MSDYREMYERAASFRGWDFTTITRRMKTFGEKWDFLDLVRQDLTEHMKILDIGTGGGEKLLGLAGLVQRAYAIDIQVSMIETARRNRDRLCIDYEEGRLILSLHVPRCREATKDKSPLGAQKIPPKATCVSNVLIRNKVS